jgi:type II restriction/modification system DNA methylase subunit YeeA
MPANNSSKTPQEFVAKWKKINLTERASAQTHFNELCDLLGVTKPLDEDPKGEWYTFERGATKIGGKKSGSQGWADVWMKGRFAWEYKRNHANLAKAYEQLQLYREALENPPLLVVSDNQKIEVHTNFTNTVKKVYEFKLDDLLDPKKLDQLRKVWTDHDSFKAGAQTTAEVTEQAAREFASISQILHRQGVEAATASHFLIRLLFCLFAEDIGLLPANLFTRLVEKTHKQPAAFAQQLSQLFATMRTGGFFALESIPYFNGGLFDNDEVLTLDQDALDILVGVSKLDWSAIEPAVLGTLFERSLDPEKRSQLGAHYTSKADILLIVEPVLMAPFRRKWEQVKAEANQIRLKRDTAANASQRTRLENELASLLTRFSDEVAGVRVLDPACGSGNFLYVALKQLLDLQKEVAVFAQDSGLSAITPSAGPQQLHGIELNEYAHELAQATIWIGYIQWLRDNGFGQPDEPILKPIKAIVNMDAVLAYDEQGKPVEPEWPEADVIIGNPPFLGDKKMRSELGDKYVNALRKLYEGRIPGQSDFVCYWFERARALIEINKLQRAGLLATQGIRGGANRTVLTRIKQTGDIFWAYSDRNWILDGANVHVSMVGFDKGFENKKELDGQVVTFINPDLSSTANLTSAKRLIENQSLSFIGTQKTGPFDLTETQARTMLLLKGNPNGLPNSDVIKPWINALDVTQRPRNMWIIDFGVDTSLELASEYEAPFEYVKKHVKPIRETSRQKKLRDVWWLFEKTRPAMRKPVSKLAKYIATPMVSKHRVFVQVSATVIPENLLVIIASESNYLLGVLQSKIHELWARSQGTQLREAESATRYTPTSCFETFPFPWPPGKEPAGDPCVEAIAQAARELVQKRDNWLNPPGLTDPNELKKRTLTNLYNQRPTWLDMAHKKLDKTVLDAYGWPLDLTDEQILEKLLALNLERAAAQGGAVAPATAGSSEEEDEE